MTVQVFAVPVFFVVFRETLETAVIVSVLLAFLKQTLDGPNRDRAVYKKLVRQVSPPSIAVGRRLTLP
jgi:high-affinity iron transporter